MFDVGRSCGEILLNLQFSIPIQKLPPTYTPSIKTLPPLNTPATSYLTNPLHYLLPPPTYPPPHLATPLSPAATYLPPTPLHTPTPIYPSPSIYTPPTYLLPSATPPPLTTHTLNMCVCFFPNSIVQAFFSLMFPTYVEGRLFFLFRDFLARPFELFLEFYRLWFFCFI